jgi:hypothetical protein
MCQTFPKLKNLWSATELSTDNVWVLQQSVLKVVPLPQRSTFPTIKGHEIKKGKNSTADIRLSAGVLTVLQIKRGVPSLK